MLSAFQAPSKFSLAAARGLETHWAAPCLSHGFIFVSLRAVMLQREASRLTRQYRVSLMVLFLFPCGLSRKAAPQKRRGTSHGRPATPAASPVTQLAAGGDRLAKTSPKDVGRERAVLARSSPQIKGLSSSAARRRMRQGWLRRTNGASGWRRPRRGSASPAGWRCPRFWRMAVLLKIKRGEGGDRTRQQPP